MVYGALASYDLKGNKTLASKRTNKESDTTNLRCNEYVAFRDNNAFKDSCSLSLNA